MRSTSAEPLRPQELDEDAASAIDPALEEVLCIVVEELQAAGALLAHAEAQRPMVLRGLADAAGGQKLYFRQYPERRCSRGAANTFLPLGKFMQALTVQFGEALSRIGIEPRPGIDCAAQLVHRVSTRRASR
jgi:hypothetical protein